MPFWVYGRDATTGETRDPLFFEVATEEEARVQAAQAGMAVDEVEFVDPAARLPPPEGEPVEEPKWRLLMTTTGTIEGRRIVRYCGVVSGEAILGANILDDLFATVRDIVGGRSEAYELGMHKARNIALQEMERAAIKLAANAIVGVSLDYETIRGSMLMVIATGTAVLLE